MSSERTRQVVVRGRTFELVGPDLADVRLRVSMVILSVQVLGQTVLDFKVSIAQIVVSIVFCALVEVVVTSARQRVVAWPASALLTGSGIALLLRASGTRHGDWWSLHGIQYFLLAGAMAMLSKYAIRPGGRHLFNPSNVGLVWCFLVLGPAKVFPQPLWWGPFGGGVLVALVVIVVGGLLIVRRVGMLPMVATFLPVYAGFIGLQALSGHAFSATWHTGPVGGLAYFTTICASPELFVFVFFMISDPQTTPSSARGRAVFGAVVAAVAGVLAAFQPTEFGIKVSLLASLSFGCALTPTITAFADRMVRKRVDLRSLARPAVLASLIIAVAAPVDTALLSRDSQLINIERRLTGEANLQ